MRDTNSHISPWLPMHPVLHTLSDADSELFVDLNFPRLLYTRHFSFRELEEAYLLAEHISRLLPEKCNKKVELGLKEIFFNAIEHGNLGIGFEEKSELKKSKKWLEEFKKRLEECLHKQVQVIFDMTPSMITITVKDEGEGFDWRSLENRDPTTQLTMNGRGLILAKNLCFDHVEFSEKGNQVKCLIYI